MFESVHSDMFHVNDTEKACQWYSKLLEIEPVFLLKDFPVLRIGSVEIGFHKADAKVTVGKAGVVIYWKVQNFMIAVERTKGMGGLIHRGPLDIEGGQTICQIADPFGSLFGIVGPK